MKGNLLFLVLLLATLMPATTKAQAHFGSETHLTDIIVLVKPGVLDLAAQATSAEITARSVRSPEVAGILTQYQATRVLRSFPGASPADTLLVSELGHQIRLIDRTKVFRFRFPMNAPLDRIAEKLSEAPGIVFAYPVPQYEFGPMSGGNARPEQPVVAPAFEVDNGISDLKSDIEFVPTGRASTAAVAVALPNDSSFAPRQWNLNHTGAGEQPPVGGSGRADIRAVEAWGLFTGSPAVRIGIIDFGVRLTHDDLVGKVTGDSDTGSSHGSHVAGIAGAITNNGEGIAGVDWHAQMISRNIQGAGPEVIYDKIISAANAGAHIMNFSTGTSVNDPLVRLAIAAVHNANILSIAASDNQGQHVTTFPSGYWEAMAVGATDSENYRWFNSNYGNHLEVVAPGANIYSSWNTSDAAYEYDSGTSMAAPHVSGLASLVRGYAQQQHGITLYHDDIRQIIRRSTDKIRPGDYPYNSEGWNSEVGFGRINAHNALLMVRDNGIMHGAATGGSIHSSSGTYHKAIFGAPGLASGMYIVKRHEVRRTVTFPPTQNLHFWARTANNVGSLGWTFENPNFAQGWTGVVPGSVTSTSATLRTHVYEVWTVAGTPLGFRPASPSNVTFAYTVLGDIGPAPLAVGISGPSFLQEGQLGIWTASATGGPGGDHTFRWYVSQDGGITSTLVRQHTTSGTSDDYSQVANQSFTLIVDVERGGNWGGDSKFVYVEPADCDPTWELCVGHLAAEELPQEFSLEPNYPNPFNPQTEIKYALPEASTVTLVVVDLLGREMARLVDGPMVAGMHSANLDASAWPSGVYLYRLEVTGAESGARFVETRRMTLVK